MWTIRRALAFLGNSAIWAPQKAKTEKGVLPWEPVASEIQPYLSGSREWWLGNPALARQDAADAFQAAEYED